jgi:hypothetical protein
VVVTTNRQLLHSDVHYQFIVGRNSTYCGKTIFCGVDQIEVYHDDVKIDDASMQEIQ